MQDLTLSTPFAVFEEMFGAALFWGMVLAAVIVAAVWLFVLIRDKSVSWRKFLLAQLSMPLGATVAVVFVLAMTHSGFADLGGPIDVIVMLGVAAFGAVGMAVLVYTLESLVGSRRTSDR